MPEYGQNSGPYSLDYKTVKHRKVTTTTILNTPAFDQLAQNLDTVYSYDVGYVPAGY